MRADVGREVDAQELESCGLEAGVGQGGREQEAASLDRYLDATLSEEFALTGPSMIRYADLFCRGNFDSVPATF